MKARTILYVSEDRAFVQSLRMCLGERDCEAVLIPASQALSFLFLIREVKIVVLDQRGADDLNLALARQIKSLRPDVEIILISSRVVEPLPAYVDACFCWSEQMDALIGVITGLLESHAIAA